MHNVVSAIIRSQRLTDNEIGMRALAELRVREDGSVAAARSETIITGV